MSVEIVTTPLKHTEHRSIKPSQSAVRGDCMVAGQFGVVFGYYGGHDGHLVYKRSSNGPVCLDCASSWSSGDSINVHPLQPGDAFSIVIK